jgi:hypothetical protein
MDGVVSEGSATAFERDAAGRRPPWGEYSQEAAGWVAQLLRLPLTAPYIERARTSRIAPLLHPAYPLLNWFLCQLTRFSKWLESITALLKQTL